MLVNLLGPIISQENNSHALGLVYLSIKRDGEIIEVPLFQSLYINLIESTLSFLWAGYFERWIEFFEITIFPQEKSASSPPRYHLYSNKVRLKNVNFDNNLEQTTLTLDYGTLWCPECGGVLSEKVWSSDKTSFSHTCFNCDYKLVN
ncbi:MAG: hypothetical protein H6Q72_1092 [Firmicutes bacterium]|nr:hypothetical protein [Bacillota bacterium]